MRFKFPSTWQELKSWYTGGNPEQRFGRRFADGLNQNSLVLSVAQAKKKALYLSVKVFSTQLLIGDTILTSATGDGIAILRGHPSHAKV